MDEITLAELLKGGHLSMTERANRGLVPHEPLSFESVVQHLVGLVSASDNWFPYPPQTKDDMVIDEWPRLKRDGSSYLGQVMRHAALRTMEIAEFTNLRFPDADAAARWYNSMSQPNSMSDGTNGIVNSATYGPACGTYEIMGLQ